MTSSPADTQPPASTSPARGKRCVILPRPSPLTSAEDHWDPGNASPAAPQTPAVLGVTPFAVIDVETTGFASQDDDRVIEIAVVHCDPAGKVTGRWTTLVDAGRDPGPTHVHGLTAKDLAGAPAFADLIDWLAELTAGRVVVAHNAPFDLAFLAAEHERADVDAPGWASLCTLELTALVGLSSARSLQECCAAAHIGITGAHSALGDAEATAGLLGHCLDLARQQGITELADLGCRDPLPARSPCPDDGNRGSCREQHLMPPIIGPSRWRGSCLGVARRAATTPRPTPTSPSLDSALVAIRHEHDLDRQIC